MTNANASTVDAVEVRTRIAASPETVFEFFVDPDLMTQWMCRSAKLDPRPGGVLRCEIRDEVVASGEFVEVDRPSRVVFTWGWEGEGALAKPGASRVEVLLSPDGEGTEVRLIHHDLPSAESAEKHEHGWRHYLDRVAIVAAGGDPGPDEFAKPPSSDA